MTFENFYDDSGAYTHSLPVMPGSLPPRDAIRGPMPEMKDGHWPVTNAAKDGWIYLPDYRQHYDDVGNKVGGTPFWLPGDTHETEARYMTTLGLLPIDVLFEKPARIYTADELETQFKSAVQGRLDAFARQRDYDGIIAACSYSGSEQYMHEARMANGARDETWLAYYRYLPEVRAKGISVDEAMALMPELSWS